MVNPIPAGWQTLSSTMSSIQRFKTDEERQQRQQTPRSHPVVFDTMIDPMGQTQSPATVGNIRRQKTIRNDDDDEDASAAAPKQYYIHSQHQPLSASSSWTINNIKAFLEASRTLENDDDAICWCE